MTRHLFHRRPPFLTLTAWEYILFALICAAAGVVLYFTGIKP